MLTKQEREAIAERVVSFNGDTLRYVDFYKCLLGEYPQDSSSSFEDDKAILDRLIELCDTSNMVELPRDKDGEVIRVGDTLYCGSSTAYKAKKIIHNGNEWEIQFFDEKFCIPVYDDPDTLTHKKPVTIASINKQLKHLLDKGEMSSWLMAKLFDIFDQLESLGDSDD